MTPSFLPSTLQLAIGDDTEFGTGNTIVEAVAGSGKTTTLLYCLSRIQSTGFLPPFILFLAFNKSIAETLQSRCPKGVECSTFHSLGFRALKKSGLISAKGKVDSRKVPKLVWDRMDREDPDVQSVIKLVSLLKGQTELLTLSLCNQLAGHYDLDFQDSDSFRVALEVIRASNNDLATIDFDDMLYLPVTLNLPFEPRDYVFVDEAQDTNDIQVEILWRLGKKEYGHSQGITYSFEHRTSPTRFLFVGDPHQAIYGFRGANSDAMERIRERFGCKTLPLDVSCRCPKVVVKEAQRYLNQTI